MSSSQPSSQKIYEKLRQKILEFEIYPGTHTSDVAFRFQEKVLPFFARTLSFDRTR